MSDLLDIYCPKCHRLYRLTPAQVGPTGRKLRCTGCSLVFHFVPEAPPPDPASQDDGCETMLDNDPAAAKSFPKAPSKKKRGNSREKLHIRALFRLFPSGIEIHGVTQDVSATGAFISTNDPPSHEKAIVVGVTGVFELVLMEGSKSAFIEMLGQVARLDDDGIGLHFLPENETVRNPNLSIPMSSFTPRPYAKVFVRRSNGSLEEGWQILPNNAQLPPTIARLYQEVRQESLSVVCRKKTPAGDGYKIYAVSELKDIQQEALDRGLIH